MVWLSAGVVVLGPDGRYADADATALDLLGVPTVEELRATAPETFQPAPRDAADAEAMRRAFAEARFQGVLAEGALRRRDGELIRIRTAIVPQPEGGYRALLYPVERPTTNLTARIYRIADILAEWRTVERRLVDVDPTTDEGRRLKADVDLLKDQYLQLFDRKMGAGA
jgi:PAS domain-containing protein